MNRWIWKAKNNYGNSVFFCFVVELYVKEAAVKYDFHLETAIFGVHNVNTTSPAPSFDPDPFFIVAFEVERR